MFDELLEQAGIFLPDYLTPQNRERLHEQIRQFPNNDFYLPPSATGPEILQGDGWRGFIALNFYTGQQRETSGLVISNSCDVAPENPRPLPPNFLFAPLVSVHRYSEVLLHAGQTPDQITSLLASIRLQRVTNIFYLPSLPYGPEEALVVLDDIHPHPVPDFLQRGRQRLFRLDQFAFYLLLLKLSIHFCRSYEGVPRYA
jgi:hypothetical protein